jgi:multidrug efflux pump subunit AcrA (membrane-fusion protein)
MRISIAAFAASMAISALIVNSYAATQEPLTLRNCLVELIDQAQVPAQEAGVVVGVKVKDGDAVTKGQTLIQMDDAIAKAERDKSQGELDAAATKASSDIDIQYAIAAKGVAFFTWRKYVEANQKTAGAIAETEVKRAELDHERARLQIDQSKIERKVAEYTAAAKSAEVAAAKEGIAHRQIKSPLDGVVLEVVPHEGEWVKPGDTVVHLVRMDRLRIEGYLNSSKYSPYEIRDRRVMVSVALAGHPEPVQFTGKITFVSPIDDLDTGNTSKFKVRAEVDNRLVPGTTTDWLLRPGFTATMTIDTGSGVAKLGASDK